MDLSTKEFHPLARIAKNTACGGGFVWPLFFAVVAYIGLLLKS